MAPAMGLTLVTGLTFTTANDATERDPVTYELSGSNASLDGPYELIASGEIVDFAQAAASPRFTQNATAIMFENALGYTYYQVMFPTVRDAGSANSMQIAEVELLGKSLLPAVSTEVASYSPGEPIVINFRNADGVSDLDCRTCRSCHRIAPARTTGSSRHRQDIGFLRNA